MLRQQESAWFLPGAAYPALRQMAVESKPLFHPEVLRQQVRAFDLPEQTDAWQPKLQHWADLIASGRADHLKETALLPDSLTDIFCGLLGYTGPAATADTYTLSRERHVEVDGKFADAVLGRFQKDTAQFTAVVEGKGTRDPLDRPFAGRRMSAVDQAYRYAINLPCDWIIVTSMRETRLYYKGAHQQAYERFETVRLAADEALLKRFVFLLGAERVVPLHRECHLYELLRASETVGRTLTNQFYALYAGIEKPSNKLLVLTELDSNTWVSEVKRLRRPSRVARRVHPHHRTHPCRGRRNLDPGAHPQRPREPGLRLDPGRDCPDVANHPSPHAHLRARHRIG